MHHSVPSPRLKTSSSTSLMHAVRLRETDVNLCRRRARSMFYETSSSVQYTRNFLTYFLVFSSSKEPLGSSGSISLICWKKPPTISEKIAFQTRPSKLAKLGFNFKCGHIRSLSKLAKTTTTTTNIEEDLFTSESEIR
uniref:Uncharacterized protein n=1 Tax=Cacopsylla melanoneura TaxID=428564 RepID=A0A8D8UQ45_9HEMI